MFKRKVISLCLIGVMAFFMMACGSSSQKESGNSGQNKENAVQDKEERVVASSVAVVEILDALGVPMVGVPTSSYELPDSVKDAKRIGNPMSPDLEIIKSLEPTTVVSVNTLSADLQDSFGKMNVPIEFVNLSSYQGLKESITDLGKRFKKEDKAKEIVDKFTLKETETKNAVKDKEGPSVLIMFGASNSFMVSTENTYVGDLVKQVGGKNVLEGTKGGFIPVDMELLAHKNPDVILLMTHANPEESKKAFEKEFATNEAWQHFNAVKNNAVHALDNGYFGMSANLQAPEAMEKLAKLFYEN